MGKILEAFLTDQLRVDSGTEGRSYEQQKLCERGNELQDKYMGNLCPIEEAIPPDADYRSLSNKIGDEREYFEGIQKPFYERKIG